MHHTKEYYLDYAAATPTVPRVLAAMKPYWSKNFANPSSLHAAGARVHAVIDDCTRSIAKELRCLPEEIIFTSGGTESINLALIGSVQPDLKKQHIISTTLEHPATFKTLEFLKRQGHSVSYVPCAPNGIVDPKAILAAITDATSLITVILVQNEIGTIQPVAEIGKELVNINRDRKKQGARQIIFHTDASQAPAFLPVDCMKLHANLLTLDGSKIYGPKGIGLLYVQRGTAIAPLLYGGGQQRGIRSGTEAVPLIVGFTEALRYVREQREKHTYRVTALREYMMDILTNALPSCTITGDRKKRIANNVHLTLPDIEGEQVVLRMSKRGVFVSTGSACSSAEQNDARIMKALGVPKNRLMGSVRITLGYGTKKRDIEHACGMLVSVVQQLSPSF